MATRRNDNIRTYAPKNIDDKHGLWDAGVWRAYNSIAEANTSVLRAYRSVGQTVLISIGGVNTEYWWRSGREDVDLVEKTVAVDLSNYYTKTNLQTAGQAQVHWDNLTNVPSLQTYTFENGLSEDGGIVKLGGTITEDTLIDVADKSLTVVNTSGTSGGIGVSQDASEIGFYSNGASLSRLQFQFDPIAGTGSIVVRDVLAKGVEEDGDYSANKTAYSYITKMMLDAVASTIPSALSFENGLREDGGVVKLGLDLTTVGTTNKGLLTEPTLLVYGDILTGDYSAIGMQNDIIVVGDKLVELSTSNGLLNTAKVQTAITFQNPDLIPTLRLNRSVNGDNQDIYFDATTGIVVTDDINQKGLEETADYSANKTAYSYVTKMMLDAVAAQIPIVVPQVQTDWDATSGLAQILNKPVFATVATTGDYNDLLNLPTIPDLTGYATESWVTSQGYITGVISSWNVNTGNLVIQGNTRNLDGRYMLRSNTITSGYGIIASSDFTGPVAIEVNTGVLDGRYLRKDVNDSNSTFALTLGGLLTETATVQSTLTLASLGAGSTSDSFLTITSGGVVQKVTLPSGGGPFTVANSAGVSQFTVAPGDTWRFNATGDASIAFNAATKLITINSSGGSTGGGVDSFNARTGVVSPASGDYNTSLVDENPSFLYFTQARVRTTPITGYVVGANTALLATDTILGAFGKVQGQINARVPATRSITLNGTTGNIAISGSAVPQPLSSDVSWTINLATVGTAGANKTKVTTDAYGRVTASAALVMGDLPAAVTQTLSLGASAGFIGISSGNSINLQDLITGGRPDANVRANASSFIPYITTSATTINYPAATNGAGFRVERRSGDTSQLGMDFWTAGTTTGGESLIYYKTFNSASTENPWAAIASRSWVLTQIPTVPTNYVTTDTAQVGMTGAKRWLARHWFEDGIRIASSSGRYHDYMQWGTGTTYDDLSATTPASSFAGYSTTTSFSNTGNFATIGLAGYNFVKTIVPWSGATGNWQIIYPYSNTAGSKISYRNGSSTVWNPIQTIASESWVLSQIPTNYVTTDSTQTVNAVKNWTERQYFNPTTIGATQQGGVDVGFSTGNGVYIKGGQASSATQSFILRGYATNGIQLELNEGGVSVFAPTSISTGGYMADGITILGVNSAGDVGLHTTAAARTIYLRPNGTGNATGQLLITPTSVTLAALAGTGTQMATISPTGVLGRAAIPAVGVTSVAISSPSAALNVTGGPITSSGTFTLSFAGTTGQYVNGAGGLSTFPAIPAGTVTSITAGPHLTGGIINTSGTIGFAPVVNTWVTDSLGNNRIYFGTTGANSIILAAGTAAGTETFQLRSLANAVTFSVNMNTGVLASGTVPWANLSNYSSVVAGNGLTGGGSMGTNSTLTLGTPGNITLASTNSVSTSSHTHNFSPGGTTAQYIRGDGTLASFPSIPSGTVTSVVAGNGMNFTTFSTTGSVVLGTPGSITLTSTNSVSASSHTHNFLPGGTTAQYIRGDGTLAAFPTIPPAYTLPAATGTVLGGIKLASNTVQTVSANSITTTASRTYGIQLNSAGQAVVNVPWVNDNTTYNAGSGITITGATNIIALDSTVIRTTGNQTASGIKTFSDITNLINISYTQINVGTGTVINFNSGGIQHTSLSSNRTFTFSNAADGKGCQLQITNTSSSSVTTSFTGAVLAADITGEIPSNSTVVFSFMRFNGVIRGTKIVF